MNFNDISLYVAILMLAICYWVAVPCRWKMPFLGWGSLAMVIYFGDLLNLKLIPLLGLAALAYVSGWGITVCRGRRWADLLSLVFVSVAVVGFVILKSYELRLVLLSWFSVDQFMAGPFSYRVQVLGFSYLVLKGIHFVYDCLSGEVETVSFSVFLTYVFFLPSFTAGPIDRYNRFMADSMKKEYRWDRIFQGVYRIICGTFKKYVLADMLFPYTIGSSANFQNFSTLETWISVICYGLVIYWDFSGYSDIAIGIGKLFGFELPENFNRPYLKSNLQAFWRSWHMTLTAWLQSYVFAPVSRFLVSQKLRPRALASFVSFTANMAICGLWHGISLHFVVWGLYHALGLSIQKIGQDVLRKHRLNLVFRKVIPHEALRHTSAVGANNLFVVCGWVLFCCDLPKAFFVYKRMFGLV